MPRIVELRESSGTRRRRWCSARQNQCQAVGLVLAIVLLIAGCASIPTGRFDALATVAKEVDTKTSATDADIVQLTRRFMVFSPAPGPYTANSFVPTIEIDGMKHDFDFGPRLEPRRAAVDVLAAYTEALAAFAKKDYQGDLDNATQSLAGSVERLVSHTSASAEAKQGAGILATAVNGLGRAIVEHKRKDQCERRAGGRRHAERHDLEEQQAHRERRRCAPRAQRTCRRCGGRKQSDWGPPQAGIGDRGRNPAGS